MLKNKKMLLFIGVFVGIILSVVTVKGLAYSDSPEFCSSCHLMTQVHDSFADSNHADLACGDCHLPHDNIVHKMTEKAKAGMGHIYYNTLGVEKIPGVLHATENSEKIIKENCVSCHENTVKNVSHDAKEDCTDCHQSVPHGKNFKTEDYYKPAKPGELLENKGGNWNNG
ncbi:cytochrome c3 family protein [Robertmurraya andreesenii]|uniref:Cytochrome c nitrite reductase small subunit n=1 Tax=Anoxybacillus andreesenii TaxID=1325932 RepID=A0ABT9UZM9_9BACL|nr:NapC/NirT family cytochrome c [Robertmurraya andreesenii]MDQ0154112.1 cytochrome c nitrite reductase small subunit [Robertmurraya andreesenii]